MTRITHISPEKMTFRRTVLVPLFNNRVGYWYLTRMAPKIDATVTPATRA